MRNWPELGHMFSMSAQGHDQLIVKLYEVNINFINYENASLNESTGVRTIMQPLEKIMYSQTLSAIALGTELSE